MTTTSAPRIRSGTNLTTDTLNHGVHVTCQTTATHVTALCGALLAWEDETVSTPEICVVCRDLSTCPLCGTRLVMPV